MDRRRRDVIYTHNMSVRLTPELIALVKRAAADAGMPPAMLARKWIVDRLKQDHPEWLRDHEQAEPEP